MVPFFRFKDMAHHACDSICIDAQPSLHVGPAISSKMIPVPQSWTMVWVSVIWGAGIG